MIATLPCPEFARMVEAMHARLGREAKFQAALHGAELK